MIDDITWRRLGPRHYRTDDGRCSVLGSPQGGGELFGLRKRERDWLLYVPYRTMKQARAAIEEREQARVGRPTSSCSLPDERLLPRRTGTHVRDDYSYGRAGSGTAPVSQRRR